MIVKVDMEAAFVVLNPKDYSQMRVHADGRIEGFPEGYTVVFNRIPAMLAAARAEPKHGTRSGGAEMSNQEIRADAAAVAARLHASAVQGTVPATIDTFFKFAELVEAYIRNGETWLRTEDPSRAFVTEAGIVKYYINQAAEMARRLEAMGQAPGRDDHR